MRAHPGAVRGQTVRELKRQESTMIQIGKMNNLTVIELEDRGAWLAAGEEYGELLLPKRQLPDGVAEGDEVAVFLYLDADCEPVITTDKPFAMVGQLAGLKVVNANKIGAFLEWGMKKDLFVPTREQNKPMQVGHVYLVYLMLDNEGRMVGTSRIERFLAQEQPPFRVGDQVTALPGEHTPLGIKVVVNDRYPGMLFKNEVFGRVMTGRPQTAWVKQVRADGKLDLTLQKPDIGERMDDAGGIIMTRLRKQGGELALGDKSEPELISKQLAMSKGTFKKAIGGLYKQGLIVIEPHCIRLVAAPAAQHETAQGEQD
ncbi:S1-like domain-containing RNA-binding protein [Aeromonas sp. BIGb0445]|uniref:CvfB family protein n=1 Tax=Aeromonas sp. BIGb0445 TaxID=2940593 RepID=UPI00286E0E4B|nr:S1-like domain-containing RNA-binding protein [Aeromonas sp. BIGb0445]